MKSANDVSNLDLLRTDYVGNLTNNIRYVAQALDDPEGLGWHREIVSQRILGLMNMTQLQTFDEYLAARMVKYPDEQERVKRNGTEMPANLVQEVKEMIRIFRASLWDPLRDLLRDEEILSEDLLKSYAFGFNVFIHALLKKTGREDDPLILSAIDRLSTSLTEKNRQDRSGTRLSCE